MQYKSISLTLAANNSNGMRVEGLETSGHNLVLKLAPIGCIFGKGKTIPILDNQPIFQILLPLFTNIGADAKGNKTLLATDAAFPEEMKIVTGGVDVTVKLPGNYVRTYTNNILNSNGAIVHRKGEIICDESGAPIVHDTISVFTIRIKDEDSPTGYAYPLGTPEELALRMLKRGGYLKAESAPADTEQVVLEPANDTVQPAATPAATPPENAATTLGF